jgi:carbon storage regulator
MLVLARRLHERIIIPSISTAVEVTAVKQGFVRLGIEAPPEVTVLREEVYRRSTPEGRTAALPATAGAEARLARINQIWRHRLNNVMLGLALLRQQLPSGVPPESLATLRLIEGESKGLCQELRALCEPAAPAKVDCDCVAAAAGD